MQLDVQRGVLSRNATLVGTAFARMWSSIAISPQHGDGLMADGSFHQHGPLLQSGSYGGALMTDVLAFSTLAAGTSFAIPPAPLAVLAAYLVNGQQYMLRGAGETAVWLIPPRGREIVRVPDKGTFPWAEVATGIAALLTHPGVPMAAELAEFQGRLDGKAALPTQTRHYPESDYTVHHRPAFSNDIRTWSSRTYNAEARAFPGVRFSGAYVW